VTRCTCETVPGIYENQAVHIEDIERAYRQRCRLCSIVWRAIMSHADIWKQQFQLDTDIHYIVEETGVKLHVFGPLLMFFSGDPAKMFILPSPFVSTFWRDESTFWRGGRAMSLADPTHLPLPTHHNAPEAIEWIQAIIQQCERTHDNVQCRTDTDQVLPTRVIQIGTAEEGAKLVTPGKIKARYIALSHCWGPEPSVRLTQASLADLLTGLPYSTLPKTFKDAILVASMLKVEYIWIDVRHSRRP